MDRNVYIVGILVLIVAVGALLVLSPKGGGNGYATTTISYTTPPTTIGQQSQRVQAPVLLTDPPQLPLGTSAVVIAYSNVSVHTTGGAGSGWVSAAANGTINLMNTLNSSTVIGSANLSANTSINLVRFFVASGTITVKGTTYNLTISNPNVTVHLKAGARINSSSAVLVDFFPTIVVNSNANATSYGMSPSATAVVVANASVASSAASVGARLALGNAMKAQLKGSISNITITSAQISSAGNQTSISVGVKDNSNSSVQILGVAIYGTTATTANAAALGVLGPGALGFKSNLALSASAASIMGLATLSFTAGPGGALFAAQNRSDWQGSAGYTLAPGATTTLAYNGRITYQKGTVGASLVSGNSYRVVVFGTGGASASATVTSG